MLEEAGFSRKEFEIQLLFSSVRLLNLGFTKIITSFVKQKRMGTFGSKRVLSLCRLTDSHGTG